MPDIEFGKSSELVGHIKSRSPYDVLIARVKEEGEYYTFTEVSKLLDVSQPTIRKVTNNEKFPAPSEFVRWGKRYVWLFTPDDVEMTAEALKVDFTWDSKSNGLQLKS